MLILFKGKMTYCYYYYYIIITINIIIIIVINIILKIHIILLGLFELVLSLFGWNMDEFELNWYLLQHRKLNQWENERVNEQTDSTTAVSDNLNRKWPHVP